MGSAAPVDRRHIEDAGSIRDSAHLIAKAHREHESGDVRRIVRGLASCADQLQRMPAKEAGSFPL
jgi:hypothetical protein